MSDTKGIQGSNAGPVIGDGVVTIPLQSEDCEMSSIDLPPNVASHLQAKSIQNFDNLNNVASGALTTANNVLAYAAARNFDKLGAVESRSVSGVLATPVAGPTTQAGA